MTRPALTTRSAVAAPIEATLAALAARLPLVGATRRSVLREVRDGLEDAAQAYRAAGLGADEAARRAVTDFGAVEVVVADYAELSAARAGQLAALALGPGYLLVLGAWLIDGALRSSPLHGGAPNPLASVFPVLGVFAVLAAGAVALGLRCRGRQGRPTWRWGRLIGAAGLICAVTTLASSYVLSPWTFRLASAQVTVHDVVEWFSAAMTAAIMVTASRALLTAARARRASTVPISYA